MNEAAHLLRDEFRGGRGIEVIASGTPSDRPITPTTEAHLLRDEFRLSLLVFIHVNLIEALVDGVQYSSDVIGVTLQAHAIESLALVHGQLDLMSFSYLL